MALLLVGWISGRGKAADMADGPVAVSKDEREDWFWSIIERTRGDDQDEQAIALEAELSKLPASEIEAFGAVFDRLMTESYSWDLWGAAYVIMGGASDDGFEYFRVWLISRGRLVFEAAEARPDELATLIPEDFEDVPEFELLAYVASEAWSKKMGAGPAEMPTQPNMIYPSEPAGEPFDEAVEDLAARYPRLWRRFSEAPLG